MGLSTYINDFKERLSRPGGPPFYFRIANLVVAIMLIIIAIIFFTWSDFPRIMLGVYEIIFGIWIIMFELAEMGWLKKLVEFMFTWRGRGAFYIFIGCLTMGTKAIGWIFGSVIAGIGVFYVVISFTTKKNESYVSDNTNPAGDNGIAYNNNSLPMYTGSTGGYGGSAQYASPNPYNQSGSVTNPSATHTATGGYLHNPI